MARRGLPRDSVKIAAFAKAELDLLVESLSTTPPPIDVGDGDLMGALILAARRSPDEAVKAVVRTYWDRELEAAAVLSVCAFITGGTG
jgi:hypothetical protein